MFVEKNTESIRPSDEQTRPTDRFINTEQINGTEPLNGINQPDDDDPAINYYTRDEQINSMDSIDGVGQNLQNKRKKYIRKIPKKIIDFLNKAIYFYYGCNQQYKLYYVQEKGELTKKDAQYLFKLTIEQYLQKGRLSKKYLPKRKNLRTLSILKKVDFFKCILKLTYLDFCVYFNYNDKKFLISKCNFQEQPQFAQIINQINIKLKRELSNDGTNILKYYKFNTNDIETLSD